MWVDGKRVEAHNQCGQATKRRLVLRSKLRTELEVRLHAALGQRLAEQTFALVAREVHTGAGQRPSIVHGLANRGANKNTRPGNPGDFGVRCMLLMLKATTYDASNSSLGMHRSAHLSVRGITHMSTMC